jgi:hypothetical protein
MRKLSRFGVAAALLAALGVAPIQAVAEDVGTSCADCPNYSGAFSIENSTGNVIHYEFRWGDKHPWKKMALASGMTEVHSYPLGDDKNRKVPTPYVRFDRVGGDHQVTFQEYKIQFHAIGYAGYGPAENKTRPKPYVFRYAANGRDLDLKAKR